MIKNLLLHFVFILLFGSIAKSEVIDGPANFRVSPRGTILFTLKDGQHVECGEFKNGWYKVSITIKISKQQFDKRYSVKKGDKLFDLKGNYIAVALSDVPDDNTGLSTYAMEIFGFVPGSNIKPGSIPEINFERAFQQNIKCLQLDSLNHFLKKEHYIQTDILKKVLPQCTEYTVYESTVVDPSPGFRIGLIFENNQLIAVEHSRHLKIGNYREFEIIQNKLFLIRPPVGLTDAMFVKKINKAHEGAD